MPNTFHKAIKTPKPLRIALTGPSDSGKTFTAHTFAAAFADVSGKRTAAVDTEEKRMSHKYANAFDFDVVDVTKPFDPRRLVGMIQDAERGGYGQFIADSGSDFWDGAGGMLSIVRELAATKFNGDTQKAWADGTPIQNAMMDAILHSPMHIIFTVRSRTDGLVVRKGGKSTYLKVGLGPMQRKDFDFKFDTVLDMDMEHNAYVAKSFDESMPRGMVIPKPSRALALRMLGAGPAPAAGTAALRAAYDDLAQRAVRLGLSFESLEPDANPTEINLAIRQLRPLVVARENGSVKA